MTYIEAIYLPDHLKSVAEENDVTINRRNNKYLKVFPNPSKNYFILEYDLRELIGSCVLRISDLAGRTMYMEDVYSIQSQEIINTTNYQSAIYIVQLLVNNRVIESHKVDVIK